ncbi:hypothetical protein [Microbacterium sp. USHLN186]|uniref:hypothetical protein n=1 Tax=Microbacterium sp. USHLN186 TaxID=3081286 RepID=UPI003018F709
MQLGTRWQVGAEPPASVPAALRPAIAEVEGRLSASPSNGSLSLSNGSLSLSNGSLSPSNGSLSPSKGNWTLTWLEGRPIAELDAGWEVLLTASGDVIARPFQD